MRKHPAKPTKEAGLPVSFETGILPLFRPMDIQCMKGKGVFLADYTYMSAKDSEGSFANATTVLDLLKETGDPRMPFGGPYWSDQSLDLFQSWIDGGCQP